jgi:hypothetical protein
LGGEAMKATDAYYQAANQALSNSAYDDCIFFFFFFFFFDLFEV